MTVSNGPDRPVRKRDYRAEDAGREERWRELSGGQLGSARQWRRQWRLSRYTDVWPDLDTAVRNGSLTLAQATTELEGRLLDAELQGTAMSREEHDDAMRGDAIATLREALYLAAEFGIRTDRREVSYRKALRALRYVTAEVEVIE